jgi:hypothetical protein
MMFSLHTQIRSVSEHVTCCLLIIVLCCLCSLAKEEELVAARSKAEELEKENVEIATKLAKKEQELDLRTQEKVCHLCILVYFVSPSFIDRYRYTR